VNQLKATKANIIRIKESIAIYECSSCDDILDDEIDPFPVVCLFFMSIDTPPEVCPTNGCKCHWTKHSKDTTDEIVEGYINHFNIKIKD
jgi:hypothetical protein